MKNLTLLLILLTAFKAAQSQRLVATSYMEHTVVSPKTGLMVGNQFTFSYPGYKSIQFTAGAFYQSEVKMISGEGSGQPHETVFTGLFTEWSVINIGKFNTLLNIRTGVQNKTNFQITPSLKATYDVTNNFSLMSGIGSRGLFSPTYIYGIIVRI